MNVLACGREHALVVDVYGVVWSTGNNSYGQLGLSSDCKSRNDFAPMQNLPVISQVFASRMSSFLIDVGGGLWVCGKNDNGMLGLGQTDNGRYPEVLLPTRVQSIPPVVMVSCGSQFSVLLDTFGAVWVNKTSMCGEHVNAGYFRRMDAADVGTVIKIGTSFDRLIAMSENHKLWKTESITVALEFEEQDVWCGDENNYVIDFLYGWDGNIIVLDQNGGVWRTNFGNSWNDKNTFTGFKKIPNIPAIVALIGKYSTSLMIDKDGVPWSGSHNFDKAPEPIPNLPRIIYGDGSAWCTLLCDEEGKVWSDNFGIIGPSAVPLLRVNPLGNKRYSQTKKAN